MALRKLPLKRSHEAGPDPKTDPLLRNVAFAAIVSSEEQKQVAEFIAFLLEALDRNGSWLNNLIKKQQTFQCALLVGAGPNRFNLQEIIYPSKDNQTKLEVELMESEDHDKIAFAALFRMSKADLQYTLDFLRNRLHENRQLKEDMLAGKDMGVHYAVLKQFTDKQYRTMERIVFSNASKTPKTPVEKTLIPPIFKSPTKKAKRCLQKVLV